MSIKLFITCLRKHSGFCCSDNKQSDLLFHFTHKQTFVDITIVHLTAKSMCVLLRTMSECVEKLNIRVKNKEITFSNSAFQYCPLVFTTLVKWGNRLLKFDELAVVGADDHCPNDSLDLRPRLTHSIAVAIQHGNARMHHRRR